MAVGLLAWRGNNSQQSSAAPQAVAGGRLSVDRDSLDFGRVPLDKAVRAEFTLKNEGDQPLRILGEPRVELVQGC
jgi:hypothetical protein